MMTVVHVILSLVEGPQKTGVGQAAASRESSPPYRHVGPARNSQRVSPGVMPNKIQQAFSTCSWSFWRKVGLSEGWNIKFILQDLLEQELFSVPPDPTTMSSPLLRHISSSSASRQRARGFLTHMSDLRHNPQFQEQSGIQTFAWTRLCTLYYHLKGFTTMILTHYIFLSTLDVVNNL